MAIEHLLGAIEHLHETLNVIYAKDRTWKERADWPKNENGSIRHPPASAAGLAAARRRRPAWPREYLEFLELHNGWEHFWLDFTLVGADGPHTLRANDKIAEYVRDQTAELQCELGPLDDAKIAKWEAADPRNLLFGRHLPFATTFGGDLLVYDVRTLTPGGDMEIVYCDIGFGVWEERRFADLGGLFSWAQQEAEDYMKRRKLGKPPRGPKATESAPAQSSGAAQKRTTNPGRKNANR